ncbi:efflux RND transporter periplasmic adaptor subunit [Treponema primitia]|uniref:efflux RND transporter periplasmic adaptor subunit n=1 Tax=Treponema primitia TaxID=88058 RepID=UPI0039814B2E
MAKQGKSRKLLIFIVTLVVIAGLIIAPSLLAEKSNVGGPGGPGSGFGGPPRSVTSSDTLFSVRINEAEVRTIQAYIEVNGNIISEHQVAVVPDAAGKLVSMRVDIGVTVRKGDIIAEIDPSRPGISYSLSPVYAPITGMVVTPPITVGSTVSTSQTIMTISGNDSLEIEALIPEREIGQLQAGLRAAITLEAFPGETFTAAVYRVSPVVDPNSRTKKVVLRFEKTDQRINSGMFARIKLNTRTYSNVITIPTDTLVEMRETTGVYVVEDVNSVDLTGTVIFREVVTGVTVDGVTEIKTGLRVGEQVVIQGQQFLTDGAAVRIVNRRNDA